MDTDYNRTIFVTGGAGFIGSNYLNKWVKKEPTWRFVNIDCLTYAGDQKNVTVSDESNYTFEKVDIREKDALEKLFQAYRPSGLIHFAAESHVDISIKDPDIFLQTNVIGTHNLLALSLAHKLERFHLISTDEVYGALTLTDDSFTEESVLAPRNPYSASKAAADLMTKAYHQTFGLNVVITRSSNTYGPNQDKTKLIPHFLTKLSNNEDVPLYGKGEQIREWTYVEDCIDAIHEVFTRGREGEVYNIGSGFELTNYELTQKLLAVFGKDDTSIAYVEDRLGHDFRYSLDTKKIQTELSWSPRISFEEGLQKTIAHYTKRS